MWIVEVEITSRSPAAKVNLADYFAQPKKSSRMPAFKTRMSAKFENPGERSLWQAKSLSLPAKDIIIHVGKTELNWLQENQLSRLQL
jgi:hypothetical protein